MLLPLDQTHGRRQCFCCQNNNRACHHHAKSTAERTNSNQSQEKSSGNYQPPTQHKKETDSSPNDEEANHPSHVQRRWRKKQKEGECEWRFGHECGEESHSARSLPRRERRKTP